VRANGRRSVHRIKEHETKGKLHFSPPGPAWRTSSGKDMCWNIMTFLSPEGTIMIALIIEELV